MPPRTLLFLGPQDYRGVWLRDYTPASERPAMATTPPAGGGGDAPAPLPPSNAYKRRVAGENWQ
jgi:citrate synthase